jgi:hypothetical protein
MTKRQNYQVQSSGCVTGETQLWSLKPRRSWSTKARRPGVAASSTVITQDTGLTTKTQDSSAAPKIKLCPRRILVYIPRKLVNRREAEMGALSEIRYYQHVGGLLMRKLPFQRLCKEVTDGIIKDKNVEEMYEQNSNQVQLWLCKRWQWPIWLDYLKNPICWQCIAKG